MRDLAKQCRAAHDPSLVTYSWIPRDENSHADRLANKALDGGSTHKPIAVVQQNFLTDRLRSAEVPTFVYFIRHGETVLTPERRFSGTGSIDPELMQDGLEQADLVATEAAKLGAEVLMASPLKRTKQTAEAISRTTGLEIIFDESWYELSFGTWDGRSTEEVRAEEPDQYQAWLNSTAYAPGGGESYDEASLRIEEALEKLVAEYPGKKIIVVTHNGVIKTAAKLAVGAPADAVFHMDATPCSISSISIWPSDGLIALRSFNERGHLR
jgi:probable phosphoglycerate mutase